MLLRIPRRSVPVLAAAVAAVALSWASPCPAPAPAARAKINAEVRQLMQTAHVPGVALGLACNGRMVFAQGYGVRSIARHLPVNPETRFQIGSITKQFTAAAILQLRAAGKLSLDDPIARFLPHFPHAGEITVRELLNQTTGLYNYTSAPHFVATADHSQGGFGPITALLAGHALAFVPGTKWQYSNTNYIVLGQIVAAASGESYADYLQQHIFTPAGMSATSLIGHSLPDTAEGYNVVAGKTVPAPPLPEAWAGSAGAIVSNLADLERWDTAVSNGKLISQTDYREMTTAGTLASGQHDDYGFGWMLGKYGPQPTVWHNGGTFGFLALNARLPQSGLDVIVLTNGTALPPWNIAHAVLHVLEPLPAVKPVAGADPAITARVRQAVEWALTGKFDRSRLTPQMNAALTPATVAQVARSLHPLGSLQSLTYKGKRAVSGQTVYVYAAQFANGSLNVFYTLDAQGKISGFLLRPAGE